MKRLRFLILLFMVAAPFSALIVNTYNLQIRKGPYYLAKAAARADWYDSAAATRGNVYFTDKSGNAIPAALNKEFPLIYAVPLEIEDPETIARTLSGVLNIDENKLRQSLDKPGDPYEPIIKKATSEEARAVAAPNLKA